MKYAFRSLKLLMVAVVLGALTQGAARATDVSEPVLLVATERLEGSGYEQTVVLAAPLPDGGHVGFIVNRPTTVRLARLFPDDGPSQNVSEPVYVGGPALGKAIFALARYAPEGAGTVLPIMPGLFAALDAKSVDRIIAATPNDARYFVGLIVWAPDELEDEMEQGAWGALPADVDTVLRAKASGLWKSLRRNMGSDDYGKRGYI